MSSLLEEAVDAHLFFSRPIDEAESPKLVALATKAVAGDANALNDLIVALQKNLLATARAVIKDPQHAEDVVQDALMAVLAKPKSLERFKNDPKGVIPFIHKTVKNKALNVRSKMARGRSTADPSQLPAKGAAGFGPKAKQIVRDAIQRALKGAKLSKAERAFLTTLWGGEEIKGTAYGAAGKAGKEHGLKSHQQTRARDKFLKALCTDQELCDLIPSGRARAGAKALPGLPTNLCKGVAGSCVEEFAARLYGLNEDASWLQGDGAADLVLSWLGDVLSER